jgi:hypothetical protein
MRQAAEAVCGTFLGQEPSIDGFLRNVHMALAEATGRLGIWNVIAASSPLHNGFRNIAKR